MDNIRLATPEEVESIREGSDVTPASSAFAFENATGSRPDFAVFRLAQELDPVIFAPETGDRRKLTFIWALENGMRMQGNIPGYYFNIAVADENWQHIVEHHGAIRVSGQPEYRYWKKL